MTTHKLTKVRKYSSLWKKIKGVIGEKEPENFGEGILLPEVNSVHTFFVSFPIDLVFLDKDNKVIRLVPNIKTFSFSPVVWKAKATLELKTGSIEKLKINLGDKVEV